MKWSLDELVPRAHFLAEHITCMRQQAQDPAQVREASAQLLAALCEMKQILSSLEREIGEKTKCSPEARFPPHIPDLLTVLAYASSRGFRVHREPDYGIIIFPDDEEMRPIAARMFPDTTLGYARALRWMEEDLGDKGVVLKDGFLKEADIQSLSFLLPSQAIRFVLVKEQARNDSWGEMTTYAGHSGIVSPGEPGYQKLRTWLLDRKPLPATLKDVADTLHMSFSYHVVQPEQECILQWEPVKGYTIVTESAIATTIISTSNTSVAHDFSDALATFLRAIGFYQEKQEEQVQEEKEDDEETTDHHC